MNMNAANDRQSFPPIYEHPHWWAIQYGELEQFQAAYTLNCDCAKAINRALAKHYDFDTGHPDLASATKEIVDKFGFDRTMYVLASAVWDYAWNGDISESNRQWALKIPSYDEPYTQRGYAVKGDHDVINRLVSQVRHDYSRAQQPQTHEHPDKDGSGMSEEAVPMDSYQQLYTRMEASYQNHYTEWMKLPPSVLIERAKEIAALQDTREFMAQGRGIDPEGVDYLLTLADPLQAVAAHWLQRMDDLSDFSFALDELCRRWNAPTKKSALAQLHEKAAAVPPKSHVPTKKEEAR